MTSRALPFELIGASLIFDGQPAFEDLSFRIGAGEVVALVGPSGAGKTSTLRLLNGMLRSTSGQVLADNRDVAQLAQRDLRALRTRIGYVPQGFGLVPNLRVAQNVLSGRVGQLGFLGSMRSMLYPSAGDLEKVHVLLKRLGIGDKIFQRVDSLSGGEQQRVALARALYQDPAALLADEPLSALDPSRAREVLELLTDLVAERGLTLVLSLHDIQLARELLPRLVGLRNGRLSFDLSTADVTDQAIRELYALDEAPRS